MGTHKHDFFAENYFKIEKKYNINEVKENNSRGVDKKSTKNE